MAQVEPPAPLSPWWERWQGWWADQEVYLEAEDPDSSLTRDPDLHTATWEGRLALDGGQRLVRIVWGPGTPFLPPRIFPIGCLSAAHQLRDGSMCLLAPEPAGGGWGGVRGILFWLNQARTWFRVFEGQGLALPPEQWILVTPLRPGPGYRDLRPGGLLLALPPSWAEGPPDLYGAFRVRVPRSGQGLATLVEWSSDHPGAWPEGEALVQAGVDMAGIFSRPDPECLAQGEHFRRGKDQRRFAHVRAELLLAQLQGRPTLNLTCLPAPDGGRAPAWVGAWLDFRPLHELGDLRWCSPAQQLAALLRCATPLPALPLTPELLHQRRDLGRESHMTDRIHETRVLLVGLGALGSEIAHLLAREGFQRFILVDGDILLPGNITRHRADLADAGRAKVDVVRDHILRVNPAAEVGGLQGWFDELVPIFQSPSEPTLLIGATGAEEIEHALGEVAWSLGLPCLHAWLEREGQVLRLFRVLPGRDPTLLELVTSPSDPLPARPAPLDAGQAATCADLVLPGSASDLHAAANFVARAALRIAGGRAGESNHWLFSPAGISEADEALAGLQREYSIIEYTLTL